MTEPLQEFADVSDVDARPERCRLVGCIEGHCREGAHVDRSPVGADDVSERVAGPNALSVLFAAQPSVRGQSAPPSWLADWAELIRSVRVWAGPSTFKEEDLLIFE